MLRSVTDDLELLARLRAGDEAAFVLLVGRYRDSMTRVARGFVPSWAVAEEVVQDAWLGVVVGVDGFEGRSSFKTWLFTILVNRARSAGAREHRSVPIDPGGAAVDGARFDATGHWAVPPGPWSEVDDRLFAAGAKPALRAALDELPDRQRQVVTLRDVEGLNSSEVCAVLGLTEANQRVILHRGRSRLRQALEAKLGGSF
jgi:RNA polymerase sigma-70 factor (ECF subfamily)